MRSRRGATEIFVAMIVAFSLTMLLGLILSLSFPEPEAPCPVAATGTTQSGATYVIRECADGTLIREYPFEEEQ